MTRQKITSSQLVSTGFDPATNTLEVEFFPTKKQLDAGQPGSVYQYAQVSPETHLALTTAESVGSYFIQNIKKDPDRFPYKKVE